MDCSRGKNGIYIVIRSYMDQRINAPSKLSETVADKLVDILLERYLGKKKDGLFSTGKVPARSRPEAALPPDIVARFDAGFLVTGTVAFHGNDATIITELVDMATGALVTTVTETARITSPDFKLTPPSPTVPAAEQPIPQPVSTVRLFIETEPADGPYKCFKHRTAISSGYGARSGPLSGRGRRKRF